MERREQVKKSQKKAVVRCLIVGFFMAETPCELKVLMFGNPSNKKTESRAAIKRKREEEKKKEREIEV
eukprot:3421539-Ditylum_brightwellii.AAC.1